MSCKKDEKDNNNVNLLIGQWEGFSKRYICYQDGVKVEDYTNFSVSYIYDFPESEEMNTYDNRELSGSCFRETDEYLVGKTLLISCPETIVKGIFEIIEEKYVEVAGLSKNVNYGQAYWLFQ